MTPLAPPASALAKRSGRSPGTKSRNEGSSGIADASARTGARPVRTIDRALEGERGPIGHLEK